MADEIEKPIDVPVIGVSFKHPLDEHGREIVFQSFLPLDCSDAQMNEFLDKLSRAGERQRAIVTMPYYKNELEAKQALLSQETNDLFLATAELDAQSELWRRQANESLKRNWRPSPGQIKEHTKLKAKISGHEHNIVSLKKFVDTHARLVSMYESRIGGEA